MKSTQYSDKVLDHFKSPRNVGTLEGDDVVVGRVGNPVCGDLMEFYVRVQDERIVDIKFKTFGCGSAIATASMITELAKGKTIDEALKITRQDVADELNGLPPIKMHCSNLAADALRDAIKKYQQKQQSGAGAGTAAAVKRETVGLDRFMDRGVYEEATDLAPFKDQRVMVVESGDRSFEIARGLTAHTPRVILITRRKELEAGPAIKALAASGVKVLYESELAEIKGFNSVEKVLVHDLNENDEYELFVDRVIRLRGS